MGRPDNPTHIFSKFAARTSVHGLPHLIGARSTKARLFWSFACLASIGMFLFLLWQLVWKYYSYEVVVKVYQVCIKNTLLIFPVADANDSYEFLLVLRFRDEPLMICMGPQTDFAMKCFLCQLGRP